MSKSVMIEADKARNLKFNYNALISLEEDFDMDITKLDNNIKLGDLRKLMYCGLKWEDESLTLAKCGEIMDVITENKGMEYMAEKVGEAISKAFGKPEAEHPAIKGAKTKK